MAVPISTALQTQIANLYISILGRNPDPVGFGYWCDVYANANGTSAALDAIASGFGKSPEFTGIYSGQTTANAVALMYNNILGRTQDTAGAAYWTGIANGYITSGKSVSDAYALTANAMITAAAANTGTADATLIASKQATAVAAGTASPTTNYQLTTNADNIPGQSGNETISATLGNNGTTQTWQTWDTINGGAGTDTINAELNGTALSLTNVRSLENININVSGAQTIDAVGVTFIQSVTAQTGANALTVNNLGAIPTINLSSTALTTLDFDDAAFAGVSALTVNLAGGSTGGITITDDNTAASGNALETINLVSNNSANTVALTTTNVGTTTVNISGSANMTFTGTDATTVGTLRTINASTATGNNTITVVSAIANTVTGGSGNDSLSGGAGNDSITSGAGNDTVVSNGGNDTMIGGLGADQFDFTTTLDTNDSVDGGEGTSDVITVTQAIDDTALLAAQVSNVEALRITASNATIGQSLSQWAEFSALQSAAVGTTGGARTSQVNYTNVADTVTAMTVRSIASGTAGGDSLAATFSLARLNDTTSNALTVNVGVATTAGYETGTAATATITVNDEESLTINSVGTANSTNLVDTLNATDMTSLVVNATNNLTITNSTGSATWNVLNASGSTGNVNIGAIARSGSVTGGSGNDTLTGSTGNDVIIGGAGNDVLATNGGNDTVTGGDGADSITSGAGNDVIDAGAGDNTIVGAAGNDNISMGSGNNIVRFNTWADITINDTITGGTGTNTIATTDATVTLNSTALNNVTNFSRVQLDSGAANQTVTVTDLSLGAFSSNLTVLNNNTNAGADAVDASGLLSSTARVTMDNTIATGGTFTAGNAIDILIGGTGVDTAIYTVGAYLSASDSINGNGGANVLQLNFGNTNTTLTAAQIAGIRNMGTITFDGIAAAATTGNMSITLSDTVAVQNASSGVLNVNRLNDAGAGDDTGTTTVNASAVTSVNMSITGAAGTDTLTGGTGNDTISGGGATDRITGNEGNDSLLGGAAGDVLSGGTGNDTLVGGDGADELTGGTGNDMFVFGSATQTGDEITDFDAGGTTAATTVDQLAFDVVGSGETGAFNSGALATSLIAIAAGDSTIMAANGTVAIYSIAAGFVDGTVLTAGTNVVVFDGSTGLSTAAAVQTAIQTAGAYTFGTGTATGAGLIDGFLIAIYDKGSSLGVGIIDLAAAGGAAAQTSNNATVTEIATIANIGSVLNINAADFIYV